MMRDMSKGRWLVVFSVAGIMALATQGQAQTRPYIAYVYPAGGQQGTTFGIKVGGQNLGDDSGMIASGSGVSVRLIQYCNPLGNRESALLGQQLRELRKLAAKPAAPKPGKQAAPPPARTMDPATAAMMTRIEALLREDVRTPACAAFRGVAFFEVTIAPDAPPGERELRLVTRLGGASNPMVFHVGQVSERSRKPMLTAPRQTLGKESQALRSRPSSEIEERINIPCTVNGQIASREVNSYRFTARKGQRLVITTQARQLVPYIADAVPGWFQPVLALYDADGREVAYDDDDRFRPDPVIFYETPKDGDYVLAIYDAIFRGRNDFVYRITIGEMPFVRSIFPLGGRVGETPPIRMTGLNLGDARLAPPAPDAGPGIHLLTAANSDGLVSNPVPFALDTLPETSDKEPNNTPARAQKITLPVIINGRMDKEDDQDVFQFDGRAGDTVVAEVYARRLDSPVDSVIRLTDKAGQLLAFSDDREDLGAGVNTHHADSYFMAKLPVDGTYCVHIGDTGRKGGEEYGYRLRISAPRPDFELRVVPSSASFRSKGDAALAVYALRHDGFAGEIKLDLKNPPPGFTASPSTLPATQTSGRIRIKVSSIVTDTPVNLPIIGSARIDGNVVVHNAVPAEDRMQAFLWRHLVPARDFKVHVFDPNEKRPPRRAPPELTPAQLAKAEAVVAEAEARGRKFTKSQVAGFARGLKDLYEKGLLTGQFYGDRIAELGLAR
jgi:hypothetical protein